MNFLSAAKNKSAKTGRLAGTKPLRSLHAAVDQLHGEPPPGTGGVRVRQLDDDNRSVDRR